MNPIFLSKPGPEATLAWQWLKKTFPAARRFSATAKEKLTADSIFWWHAFSIEDYRQTRTRLIPLLKNHLAKGGRLLLTLQACQAVVDLEVEQMLPSITEDRPFTEDTGEHSMRGFLSFMGHPLFSPFHGGIDLWKPVEGERMSRCGYLMSLQSPEGEAIAVNRFYLGNDPDKIFVWEYPSPRILCVGAYIYFATQDDLYRPARTEFLHQCFHSLRADLPTFRPLWPEPEIGVKIRSANGHQTGESGPFQLRWPDLPHLDATNHLGAFFDLAGERILLMGKIGLEVSEIWVHPFRLLHHLQIKIQGKMVGPNVQSAFVGAERVHWQAQLDGHEIEMSYFVAANEPLGAIVIAGAKPEQMIEIGFSCDLRLMWNYPVGMPGKLQIEKGHNKITVHSQHADLHGWFGVDRASVETIIQDCSDDRESQIDVLFKMNAFAENEPVIFRFGGAFTGEEAGKIPDDQKRTPAEIGRSAALRVKTLLKQTTPFVCPDQDVVEAFQWARLRTDCFFARTPLLGNSYLAGYGTTRAGWNESRPGYSWYFGRDTVFTAFAALLLGQFEQVAEALRFLARLQQFDGKIFHECTTSGIVHYDAADATPLFLLLLARYYHWTGDKKFLRELWPSAMKAMRFLFSTDRDGDGFIENTNVGHGWIEGGHFYGAHTTFYLAGLWVATLREGADLASVMGDMKSARAWENQAKQLQPRLNQAFWLDENRHFALGKCQDGSLMPVMTIMPSVPAWLGVCDMDKARLSVMKMFRKEMMADWGARMVSEFEPFYKPLGYHEGSVWPLFTGWVTLAGYHLGFSSSAYQILRQHLQIYQDFSPGNMPEVLNGDVYQPAGVCPHQAWSESMCIEPLVEGVWGIATRHGNELVLRPQLPIHWHQASIRQVQIGKSQMDINFRRNAGRFRWEFILQGEPLKFNFQPGLPAISKLKNIERSGESISKNDFPPGMSLQPGKTTIIMEMEYYFDIVPPFNRLQPGQKSQHLALIELEAMQEDHLKLVFQARSGSQQTFSTIQYGGQWQPQGEAQCLEDHRDQKTWRINFPDVKRPYSERILIFARLRH